MVDGENTNERYQSSRRDHRRGGLVDSVFNLADSVIGARRRIVADVLGNVADSLRERSEDDVADDNEAEDRLSRSTRASRVRPRQAVADALDAAADSIDRVRPEPSDAPRKRDPK